MSQFDVSQALLFIHLPPTVPPSLVWKLHPQSRSSRGHSSEGWCDIECLCFGRIWFRKIILYLYIYIIFYTNCICIISSGPWLTLPLYPRTRPTRGGVVVDEAQTCLGKHRMDAAMVGWIWLDAAMLLGAAPYAMALLALAVWRSPTSLYLSNAMIMLEVYGSMLSHAVKLLQWNYWVLSFEPLVAVPVGQGLRLWEVTHLELATIITIQLRNRWDGVKRCTVIKCNKYNEVACDPEKTCFSALVKT